MKMNEYQKFKTMLDAVCKDIISKNKEPIVLANSGGLDSIALLISLAKNDKVFFSVHECGENGVPRQEHLMGDFVSEYLTRKLEIPHIQLPYSRKKLGKFYKIFPKFGFNTIITGDGMDRCYGYFALSTFGMEVKAKYPLIDMFLKTIPTLIKVYRKNPYSQRIHDDLFIQEIAKECNCKIIQVSTHPMFVDFFSNCYQENVQQIVFPKLLTRRYVDEHLGRSFNSVVREVYRLNKKKMTPFAERLLNHLQGRIIV